MNRTFLGGLLIAAGLVLFVISLFGDSLGLGDREGIGTQQTIGMVVGALALIGGLVLMYRERRVNVTPRAGE